MSSLGMAFQWNLLPQVACPFSSCPSSVGPHGCRMHAVKRNQSICENGNAANCCNDSFMRCVTSIQPDKIIRSTALFMLASFTLGVRTSLAFSSSDLSNKLSILESQSSIEKSPQILCTSTQMNASYFIEESTCTFPDEDIPSFTARRFMQSQDMDQYTCDAHKTSTELQKMFADLRLGKATENRDMEKSSRESTTEPLKMTIPLRIAGLRGSVPPIWVKDFRVSQGRRVNFSIRYQNSLNETLSALRMAVKKKDAKPDSILCSDLVTIGDSWLQLAISDGLIQPIKDAESQEWFNKLGANWKEFARRNHDGALSQDGLIWGVPYRWGTMVIAYKKDRLSRNNIPAIEDWKDLWRPELKGQITMVDSPREVVGIVLKSLGASYNAQDFEHDVEGGREAVKQQFSALHEQVKVFDNIHYLKAFGLDDVWVAVGWSCDLIPVAKRMSNVNVVVPKSGASLWADFWAIPAGNAILGKQTGSRSCEKSPLIHQWLDFCLQPARSLPFRQGTFIGYPPFFLNCTSGKTRKIVPGDFTDVVKGMVPDSDITDGMLPKDGLERSEMLEPLSEKAVAEYRWLFSQATEWHTYTERGMFARSKNSSN